MLSFKFLALFVLNNFILERFFRISYSLTRKRNFGIDFFQVLTYCNFFNFVLIELGYKNNWCIFISATRNEYCNFLFKKIFFFINIKYPLIFTIWDGYGWLTN